MSYPSQPYHCPPQPSSSSSPYISAELPVSGQPTSSTYLGGSQPFAEPQSSSSAYPYGAGDRTPYSHLSPGASSVDSPAPPTPPAFLAPPAAYYAPRYSPGSTHMSNLTQAAGRGYGGGPGYSSPPPSGQYGQRAPTAAYAPPPTGPAIREPYADSYQGGSSQDSLWAPPDFTPQDLVVHGPSVPFGFKAPLPLPLPAPFSPNQPRQILQPYHATPTSPAPPVYPIYEGPPIIAEVDMPSEEDWQVWKTTDAREGIIDMLTDDGEVPARPAPICKRCHDYKVECSWPGQEGQGSCSNCFFAYSSCEIIPQSDSTPTQKPAELSSSPSFMEPMPPATYPVGSSPGPSRQAVDAPRQRIVQNLQQQYPGAQSFGQAAAGMAHQLHLHTGVGPRSSATPSEPRKIAGLPAGGSSPLADPNPDPSPMQQSRSSSPPRRQSEIDTEMEKLRSRVGELQMNAQLGLGRIQDELKQSRSAAADNRSSDGTNRDTTDSDRERSTSVGSTGTAVSA